MTDVEDWVTISRKFLRTVVSLIVVCIVGLLGSVVLVLSYSQQTGDRLKMLEEYVQGRGEFRDAESERLEAFVNRVVCDILGEFPAGDPRADRLRERYNCLAV